MSSRPLRVVHATTVHTPFDMRIFHKECVTLAQAGLDVTLVQRGTIDQRVADVSIRVLPTYGSRWARMTLGVLKAITITWKCRPDVFHFHDPELIWGALLLKMRGVRTIYDVHENLHLDLAAKQWLPKWSKGILGVATRLLEWLAYHAMDAIVAATDGIARRFPGKRTIIVRNAPIAGNFAPPEPSVALTGRAARFIYIGGLGGGGDVKGVDLMLAALAALPEHSPVRLLLGGAAPYDGFAEEVAARPGGARVDYMGFVDPAELGACYATAIGALVLYPPMPNNVESEPVKLFEAMASGIPVIVSDFPLFRDYMSRWGCGFAVDAADAAAVASLMTRLEEDRALAEGMGHSGQQAILRERNWSIYGSRLVGLYGALFDRKPIGPDRRPAKRAAADR